ncbi:sodium:phosphate symporter [Enterovibrio norvegicus FF-33]|uniref:Sodium:phosphate symporter n=1 Tax=Enterovibrio norvegicus FF-454 TaxID=1185651 RepID=A0A1E5C4S9_9GAMM|nr:Na/Pi symporter [Enterovibrio norvegicus]OEE60202.1 sodium:phosphate symporter [Enterovibrio norvegicus FF-454]OEE66412.1 sodium:phosphate symporter [Enterovibrio norvegicus FF-33]OEE85334.1 sodium:phosphate symporter [Enterovibrio norvegicus FF-162]
MSIQSDALQGPQSKAPTKRALQWAALIAMLYLLLVSVSMIGSGFKWAAGDHAKELFEFASNPVAGLMIGIIGTALIQSSSTVTSIIVGLVAGGLPVELAIPMVMGANVGTTVTNTLVSLGHARCKDEFRRAFTCATVHDFFNLIAVAIFLPLEMMTGFLAKISAWLVSPLMHADDLSMKSFNFIKPITKPVVNGAKSVFEALPGSFGGIALVIFGILLVIAAITVMGKLMKRLMVGRAREVLNSAIGRGPIHGIASGTLVTILVQSSSTTTSLVVPLVGTNVLTVRKVYPFMLGANIGTCITALLAATAVTGDNAVFALQIALVHLTFNVLGIVVIYGLPFLRDLPVKCAETLADYAVKSKLTVVGYLATVFVLLPGLVLLVS